MRRRCLLPAPGYRPPAGGGDGGSEFLLDPVSAFMYCGSNTVAGLNGLTPLKGECYAATDAGTPTAGTSDPLVAGDGAEYDGESWKKRWDAVGGYPPSALRVLVASSLFRTLVSPLTHPTDSSKVAVFGGSSFTPTLTAPTLGQIVTVKEGVGIGVLAYADIGPAGLWAAAVPFGAAISGEVAGAYFPAVKVDDVTIEITDSDELATI